MTFAHTCPDCGAVFASPYSGEHRCEHCRSCLRDNPPVPGVGDPYAHGRRT